MLKVRLVFSRSRKIYIRKRLRTFFYTSLLRLLLRCQYFCFEHLSPCVNICVYIWLAVCSKSKVMLKDSTTLSVNVPWVLLTPFLRIGARHRAFFSSLDLWRLVQETILYFQLAMSCIFQITKSLEYKISGLWNLLPSQLHAIDIKESSKNKN